jgi:hypothetical protein
MLIAQISDMHLKASGEITANPRRQHEAVE